jgi:serine/threonine protein kinase
MIGKILDGKYRIEQQLGAGGMGNVYLAMHLGTTRLVAVKVIAPKWAANPHFLARFQREAQACGRLRHPNIVNVTDFGIATAGTSRMPYLVMELLDGQTLSAFQKTTPRPSLPLIADLLEQVGLALAQAHQQGIVHRDLKPDNIWLEPNGRGGNTVKVLDFGVAKMNPLGEAGSRSTGEAGSANTAGDAAPISGEMETIAMSAGGESQLVPALARTDEAETVLMAEPSSGAYGSDSGGQTMPGSLVGTPAYMSPEQALGKETDYRSDIYSLAVVGYSLVFGELPSGGTAAGLVELHKTGNPCRPANDPKVPRDVSDAILAGLARDPADRPRSAAEFARRFHNAVDGEFLALRRSRAFLLQHLATFAFLLVPIYAVILSLCAVLGLLGRKLLPVPTLRIAVVTLAAAGLFVFSDNVLRAVAAFIAMDERVRVRRLLSFRVFWKLVKALPRLAMTQLRAAFTLGSGWVTGDCLWPVICAAEGLTGRAAVLRSRHLMTGLNSAGRALAIRHLALAALAIGDLVKSLGAFWRGGHLDQPDVTVTGCWFPLFAVFAAAPLFLYDRTAAQDGGPLLQLDRTPEIRTTARPLSVSSFVWLTIGALYLLYQPIKALLFGFK